ncbi:MAG: helix-turn-helix domain-containing protein [Planctomycetales bacterium]|nr:helix-turn-helix domain-containing protein [Planctomycetales bacterium]
MARRPAKDRNYYTTSEVARLARVHKNTILAAIRAGKLAASRTPGGHGRVSRDALSVYLRAHGLPDPFGSPGPGRQVVLVVGEAPESVRRIRADLPRERFDVVSVQGLFEAGAVAARLRPSVLVLACDEGGPGWGISAEDLSAVPGPRPINLIGVSENGTGPATARYGIVLRRAFERGEFALAVGRLVGGIEEPG